MRRPRILHLIDTPGPGGAETVFLELVKGLPDHGWDSVPVVPDEGWLHDALRGAGFAPRVLSSDGRRFDVAYARALRRLVRSERIDLIQTHLLGSAVYSALASLGTRVPMVSTFHGQPDISPSDRLRRVKVALLSRRKNRVVCVSESLRAHLSATARFPRSSRVIPNGVDFSVFRPGRADDVRREWSVPGASFLVGAVGNVRPSKAYHVLLRAFARVREGVPESRLVIVGQTKGTLFDELRALQTELELEDACNFVGFREDVPDVLRALDVFALSSTDEGFSLAVVQAMGSGVPVVATRCGGPEQIVGDSEAALLVPTDNPDALARAIVEVWQTPGLGPRLAERGRRRAAELFSLDRMVARYSDLYAQCLQSS